MLGSRCRTDWRLIRGVDDWWLFKLMNDPRETMDVATSHPEVVADMRNQYDAFIAKLPPRETKCRLRG